LTARSKTCYNNIFKGKATYVVTAKEIIENGVNVNSYIGTKMENLL